MSVFSILLRSRARSVCVPHPSNSWYNPFKTIHLSNLSLDLASLRVLPGKSKPLQVFQEFNAGELTMLVMEILRTPQDTGSP